MKKLLGFILFLTIIIGLFYFAFNTGKNVKAEWTEEDFNRGIEKSKVKINNIEEINLETLISGNFSTKGTNSIDDFFTEEELSALISKANDLKGPIKDIKISITENGKGEVSFKLSENFIKFLEQQTILIKSNNSWEVWASEYEENSTEELSITDKIISYLSRLVNKKPIYGTGELFRDSDSLIKIKIDTLKVGQVSLPKETIDKVEYETIKILNVIISEENGFYIEELEIRDNGLYYKGTLPAEIEGKKI